MTNKHDGETEGLFACPELAELLSQDPADEDAAAPVVVVFERLRAGSGGRS